MLLISVSLLLFPPSFPCRIHNLSPPEQFLAQCTPVIELLDKQVSNIKNLSHMFHIESNDTE